MQNEEFLAVLTSYGAADLSRCFLVKDSRSDRYSVGLFNNGGKPIIIMEDNEDFHNGMVEFLRKNDVKSYDKVADVLG